MELSTEAIMRIVAAQVPDIARRSVEVPTVRIGTVDQTTDPSSTYVAVLMDGMDDQATAVLNGTGSVLLAGQRVSVLFYPPHGAMVVGVLAPVIVPEQIFSTLLTVPSAAVTTTSTEGLSTWTEETTTGGGWEADSGGRLVCRVAGLWQASLHSGWASRGAGTHRAAAVADASGTQRARISSQWPGTLAGTPTAGFGLSSAGFGLPWTAAVDDTLVGVVRQDSGADLDVTLFCSLRLLSV